MKEMAFSMLLPFRGNNSRMVSMGTKMRALVPLLPSCPTFADADDVEAHAIEEHGRADGGPAGENIFQQFPSDNRQTPVLRVVLVVEPASCADGDGADLVILGRDAEDLAVGRSVLAHGANILAVDDGGDGLQGVGIAAQRHVVVIGEVISLA